MRVYKNHNQSNNDSVTEDPLILASLKFEEEERLCLGNDDKNDRVDKILYKKQNRVVEVQLISCFFLHHNNLKKTKNGI